MLDIKRSIATGWGKGGLYDILKELQLFNAGLKGEVYFVENNAGYDGNDGKSWNKAFKTLSVALAASHANIAAGSKGWAARNTIFLKGDSMDEDLTKLAQKTDIIGVGSCHDVPMARLEGHHVIQASSTENYNGCRFFNIDFYSDGSEATMVIPTNHNGIEFHNCRFMAVGVTPIHGIHVTAAVHRMKVINCKFVPDSAGRIFDTAAILTAGTCTGIEIIGNVIYGKIGIHFSGSGDHFGCFIKDNLIYATTLCIDDDSDKAIIVNNRMISAANVGATAIDYNVKLAAGNILTGADDTMNIPTTTA